jgi:hypothetical protein
MMKSELLNEYYPYNHTPAFHEGWDDYFAMKMTDRYDGVAGQAYDRGAEAAMRWSRQGHTR